MSNRHSTKRCAKCGEAGFRFRGDRWLCLVHNRFDTMQNQARAKGKYVPTFTELATLAADLIARGMKCEACQVVMQWAGKRGDLTTVSLQHDRSGRIRLICVLCNSRHDDMPGDTFYDLPCGHWRCVQCKVAKPRSEFHRSPGKGCKSCVKATNRALWKVHGKKWQAASKRRRSKNTKVYP